jgi:hypothetical protein
VNAGVRARCGNPARFRSSGKQALFVARLSVANAASDRRGERVADCDGDAWRFHAMVLSPAAPKEVHDKLDVPLKIVHVLPADIP